MKNKFIVIVLFLTVCCVFGNVNTSSVGIEPEQEANLEGWRDFVAFTGLLNSTDSAIQNLYNSIISLQSEETAIIDDAERKAEMLKIVNIHPDYDLDSIVAKLQKFNTLKSYLEENGYIE